MLKLFRKEWVQQWVFGDLKMEEKVMESDAAQVWQGWAHGPLGKVGTPESV